MPAGVGTGSHWIDGRRSAATRVAPGGLGLGWSYAGEKVAGSAASLSAVRTLRARAVSTTNAVALEGELDKRSAVADTEAAVDPGLERDPREAPDIFIVEATNAAGSCRAHPRTTARLDAHARANAVSIFRRLGRVKHHRDVVDPGPLARLAERDLDELRFTFGARRGGPGRALLPHSSRVLRRPSRLRGYLSQDRTGHTTNTAVPP